MRPSFAQIRFPLLAAVLASALCSCASLPPPTGELASARQAVTRAEDADADLAYAKSREALATSEFNQRRAEVTELRRRLQEAQP